MIKSIVNINENDYIDVLKDSLIDLKRYFTLYSNNKTPKNYLNLKRAVYSFSCNLKSSEIASMYSSLVINDLRDIAWGMLVDDE